MVEQLQLSFISVTHPCRWWILLPVRVGENAGESWSDTETCICVNGSLRPARASNRKTHFHLESPLPPPPPHSTLHHRHVYCVHKLAKGTSCLGVVAVRHRAVSLEKWQALFHKPCLCDSSLMVTFTGAAWYKHRKWALWLCKLSPGLDQDKYSSTVLNNSKSLSHCVWSSR